MLMINATEKDLREDLRVTLKKIGHLLVLESTEVFNSRYESYRKCIETSLGVSSKYLPFGEELNEAIMCLALKFTIDMCQARVVKKNKDMPSLCQRIFKSKRLVTELCTLTKRRYDLMEKGVFHYWDRTLVNEIARLIYGHVRGHSAPPMGGSKLEKKNG